jgi:hypothetical protein
VTGTITTVASIAYIALAIWRINGKPAGQWMVMAAIAACLTVFNGFDAVTNHTIEAWLRAATWAGCTAIALLGARSVWARAEAEAYVARLRIPGGPR